MAGIKMTPKAQQGSDDTEYHKKATIPVEGEATIVMDSPGSVSGVERDPYSEALAFMEEKMKIIVYPQHANESDTSRLISVGVNGKKQYIMAGKEQWVRRKHVERLVRARPDYVQHTAHRNAMTAAEQNVMDIVSRTKYSFEVLEDPNPKGRQWLSNLRAEQKTQS